MANDNQPDQQPTAPARGGRASARAQARASGAPPPHVPRAERRPEMVKERKENRTAEYEKQQRQWLLTKIALGAFGVLVVIGIAFVVWRGIQDRALNVVPDGVQNYSYTGAQHTNEPVTYAELPPVGGEHNPQWQNCGFYSTPIANENGVHSLEHGAVWITYSPDLPADQVELLRQKAEDPYILVSPFEGLPSPVVASSWNHQLQLQSADAPELDQFIRVFRNGPDTPEPGAVCFSGVGAPE